MRVELCSHCAASSLVANVTVTHGVCAMHAKHAWKAVVVNEISRKPANSLCSQTGSLSEKVQQRQQKCKLHILATVVVVDVVVVVVVAVVCRLSKVAVNYTLHLTTCTGSLGCLAIVTRQLAEYLATTLVPRKRERLERRDAEGEELKESESERKK